MINEAVAAVSVIEVERLVKTYGSVTAVGDISFAVAPAEIFGLLGPNGAGKSTTIKILATLERPSSGQAMVAGQDVVREPAAVRQAIGIVFQDPSLDDRLTAQENLELHALLYRVPPVARAGRMAQLLEMVGLFERRGDVVRTFSGGMKRRLEIARGLLHHPKILFLDEPTTGLDPQTRRAIWDHVRQLRDELGTTVFMTTHYLEEAENCDRIAIVDHGSLQAVDTPEALKRGMGGDQIIVRGDDDLGVDLQDRYGVAVKATEGEFCFLAPAGAEFIPRVVGDFGGRIKAIAVKQPSLDDVFLKLTGRAIRAEQGTAVDRMRLGMRAWGGRR